MWFLRSDVPNFLSRLENMICRPEHLCNIPMLHLYLLRHLLKEQFVRWYESLSPGHQTLMLWVGSSDLLPTQSIHNWWPGNETHQSTLLHMTPYFLCSVPASFSEKLKWSLHQFNKKTRHWWASYSRSLLRRLSWWLVLYEDNKIWTVSSPGRHECKFNHYLLLRFKHFFCFKDIHTDHWYITLIISSFFLPWINLWDYTWKMFFLLIVGGFPKKQKVH